MNNAIEYMKGQITISFT